jgi:UDP-N-acetylmuramate dehydrogenase
MQFQENISLKPYNSFGIDARARYFTPFKSVSELQSALTAYSQLRASNGAESGKYQVLIIGGGSNILFTQDFNGLVLKNDIRGFEKVKETDEHVYVRAGAGENWHYFVMHCIKNNWAGVENLSLIPGCVGASPMQNIGAYGVEVKEVFHELTAFHLQEKCNYTFSLKDCAFGYRDSVFKNKYKDQFAILNVTFRLNKLPVFNTSYGAIEQELERMGTKKLSIKAISTAVINIRNSKLPDPKEIGNAGSFFKNPSITKERFLQLKDQFENIVGYENEDGSVKLAAGWLIEQCGWKGYREGNAGVHEKQALVLVNHGDASGAQLYEISEKIMQSVLVKFGVHLEREVNIL